MYFVGALLEIFTLALFLYLAWTGYEQGVQQAFMSLQADAGNCQSVLTPMTGTFMIDKSGNWETDARFTYTEAQYKYVFTDFLGDIGEFYQLLNDSYTELEFFGHLHAANNDLAYNLVLWAFFNSKTNSPNGVEQKLVLTGATEVIYNRQYKYGLLSNSVGDCKAESITSFDPSTYILQLQYDYDTFMADGSCNTTVDPAYLGYSPTIDNGRFHMDVDVRTLTLALAINLGVVELKNLDLVDGNYR